MSRLERRRAAREAARRTEAPTVVLVRGEDGSIRIVERFTVAEGRRLLEGGTPKRSAAPQYGRQFRQPQARQLPGHEFSAEVIEAFAVLDSGALEGEALVTAMKRAGSFGERSVRAAEFVTQNCASPIAAFTAAHAIGYVSGPDAFDALVKAFLNGDIQVAMGAARALVADPDPRTDDVLEQLLAQVPRGEYLFDIMRSVAAHRRLPDLYRRDPSTVTDEEVWSLYRFWAEQCRMDPYRMAAIAQPLEHLRRLDALEMDVLTETMWRAVCAARLRPAPQSPWPGVF